MNVQTDKQAIDEILARSIAHILPSKEEFKDALSEGRKMRFYVGADPTGPELHIGHATNFIFLERIRQLGHEVVVLFGDFTAMIGDPTGKDAPRKRLSEKEVKENVKTWKMQAGKILDMKNKKNPVKIVFNSAWYKKFHFSDVINLASHMTVQQMVERDMFQERLKGKKPIYLHEFLYPLLQGYDSVMLDVDVEVGGTDQMFNMLVGRTLQRVYNDKNKFVIATHLLEDPNTGKKLMSKSEGKYIALNDNPDQMFGKAMALPDTVMSAVFRDCTYITLEELDELQKKLEKGENPRDIKLRLAYEIVKTYHNEDDAIKAKNNFINTFQKKTGIFSNAEEVHVLKGSALSNILVEARVVSSKSELRRLVREGAIKNFSTGDIIKNSEHEITENLDLKIGKKRFVKIRV